MIVDQVYVQEKEASASLKAAELLAAQNGTYNLQLMSTNPPEEVDPMDSWEP